MARYYEKYIDFLWLELELANYFFIFITNLGRFGFFICFSLKGKGYAMPCNLFCPFVLLEHFN
jgi:hypothetical protein